MLDVCSGDQADGSVVILFRFDLPPTAENDWGSDGKCGEVERLDAQLVVHTFNEEENLILLNSEFVVCVRLGFVVVGCLKDSKVSFWIVGHVERRYQVKVTAVI